MLEEAARPHYGACSVWTRRQDGVVTISVSGEVDRYTVPALERALAAELEQPPSALAIELNQCEFIDSTGLAALVTAHRGTEAAGTRLVLLSPSNEVQRALELTGLNRLLTITESSADA